MYNCIKRVSYLHIAYAVGKWTQPTCREMLAKVSRRISMPGASDRLTIYSDGNDDYAYVLPEFYPIDSLNYGQVVKVREKGTVVGKVKRAIYGNPNPQAIEITNIENFHSILRERIGRLVRKTKCFPKKKKQLENAIELFQFHWNTMDPLPNKSTPAMMDQLTDHAWSWHEFFYFRLSDTL